MINLAVVFGSRSAEHDVSIISALQILENADKTKYNAFPVYISRNGEWFVGEALRNIKIYSNFNPAIKGLTKVILPPAPNHNAFYSLSGGGIMGGKGAKKVADVDCAILALHGMHGEDGTIQGLFELANIPYSSCSITGSALGMDKIIMKSMFREMGIPTLKDMYCYRSEWQSDAQSVISRAEAEIGYPMFVKPANLGSSIGINKAVDKTSLSHALDVAAAFDRRILIEKGLDKPMEINCACLGFGMEAVPSLCEEPLAWEEFLTFEDKYTRGGGKGMQSLARKIPASVSDEITKRIQDYTVQIFRKFECKGVVRIDYMIERETGELFVCEINTIPGSFAYYLFEPMGISFGQLVDKLVEYAHKALVQKNESTYAYDSIILKKAANGTKNKLK